MFSSSPRLPAATLALGAALAPACGGTDAPGAGSDVVDPAQGVSGKSPPGSLREPTSEANPAASPDLVDATWPARGFLRLTPSQLRRTLSSLFKTPLPDADFDGSQAVLPSSFSGDAPRTGSLLIIDGFLMELSDAQLLEALGCTGPDASCAGAVVSQFAPSAWRRPLLETEEAALLDVYHSASTSEGLLAIRQLVTAILHAPGFYALPMLGTEAQAGIYQLDDFEIASLLAYFLTFLPPDTALLSAAREGRLRDAASRQAQAQRLWNTPAGHESAAAYVRDWLNVSIKPATEERLPLQTQLRETELLIEDLLYARQAPVSELLTADYTFVDARLGEFYGIDTQQNGWQRVSLEGTGRLGILHHASWLRSFTGEAPSYAKRGTTPAKLLCEPLPTPPEAIDTQPPEPDPNSTGRQLMEAATAGPACEPCHRVFDPLAFSFEHFDGFGAYRELDGKQQGHRTKSWIISIR